MRPLVALVLFAVALVAAPSAAERAHVYLIVVDGLDARWATAEHMPRLFAVLARDAARSSTLPGRAVMPTRTNPNHVTLMTGVFPEIHGITGNNGWDRDPSETRYELRDPALIQVQTFFTLAETTTPALETAGVFGKAKLGRLFGAVPGKQRAPDFLWAPGGGLLGGGKSDDADVMSAAIERFERVEPDLAFLNLAGVDRTAHRRGPDDPACGRAVSAADVEISRLIAHLDASGRWQRSVLVVTADHGFSAVGPTAERPHPVIDLGALVDGGTRGVADGPVAHVYATGMPASATSVGDHAAALAQVVSRARSTAGVAEVLARLPLDGVPLLATVHPDWHLANPRTGELLLVARQGYQFADPGEADEAGHLGNHGGPHEQAVPVLVTGGHPGLRVAGRDPGAQSAARVGATVAALVGLPPPRRVDGSPLPPDAFGPPIAELFAVDPAPTGRTD